MMPMARGAARGCTRRWPASWASVEMLLRICAMSELRLVLLLNEWDTRGQQGIGRQGSAQMQRERSDRVAAWWAEAAHRIWLDHPPNRKILSAG